MTPELLARLHKAEIQVLIWRQLADKFYAGNDLLNRYGDTDLMIQAQSEYEQLMRDGV